MRYFLLLLFFLPGMCLAQVPYDFTLCLSMSNSVHDGMYDLIIECNNDRGSISLIYRTYSYIYSPDTPEGNELYIDIATVDTSALIPLTNFMKTYDHKYVENINPIPSTTYIIRADPSRTTGSIDYNGLNKKIDFEQPYRRNQNTILGEMIVRLLHSSFSKPSTFTHIANVPLYFTLPKNFR